MDDRDSHSKESASEKSCWQEALEKLHVEYPRLYAQLEETLATKAPSLSSAELSSQIVNSIAESKRRMLDRDLPSHWKHSDESEKAKFRTAMDHVLKAVTVFRDMGSAVAQIDPSHVGIAWIGVNLILQLVLNGTEQNAAALQGLAQISPIITRYAKIEEIYIDQRRVNHDLALNEDFRTHVINLYTSILVYQGTIILHSKRTSIVQFARAFPKLDDWGQLLQEIVKLDAECQKFTRIFDFEERSNQHWEIKDIMKQQDLLMERAHHQLDHIDEQSQLLVRNADQHENMEVLDWVSTASPDNDHTRILEHGRLNTEYASSGQWLFSRPEFESWSTPDDDSQSALWLAGPVGTGKSSLVCLIVEKYRKEAASSHEKTDQLAFFYCSRKQGTEEASSPKTILRSLVRQLAWSPTTLSVSPIVKERYRQCQQNQGHGGRELRADDCIKLLTQLITSDHHTRIIIDALDECSDFDELLSYLQEIVSACQGRVKFLLSSRMNVSVQDTLPQSMRIDVGLDSKDDIEFFIKTKVTQNQRRLAQCKASDLENRLIKTLSDRAQGMFRWVELQLEVFFSSKSTIKRRDVFKRKLESLEAASGRPELDQVYDEIYKMNAPEPEDGRVAERALKWIMCCRKPLSIEMLTKAASFDCDGRVDEEVDADYIMSICSNFIIIDHDHMVQFAHLSVREYLMNNPKHGYTTADAHGQAGRTSLFYLLAVDSQKNPDSDKTNELLQYAQLYWPFHCSRAPRKNTDGRPLQELIKEFLLPATPSSAFTTCLKSWDDALQTFNMRELKSPLTASLNPNNSPVFTACAWGFYPVVQTALSRGFSLNDRNLNGDTALAVASQFKKIEIVRLLLENGANPNAAAIRSGYTPLHYGFKSLKVAQALIDHGADVTMAIEGPINNGWTALHLATWQERQDVVEFLLANGADVNAKARRSSTPLHTAALSGNIAIARVLLEHGALARFENDEGETPLQKAASSGEEDMVAFLLKYEGIDSDTEKWTRQAQFYNAVCKGEEGTVQLLLEKGVDMKMKSQRGEYPLHWAVRRGQLRVASLLLRNGADIDAKDKFDETALLSACKARSEEAVNFLLDEGADINLKNGKGREECTVLSFAISQGMPKFVEILLRRGADSQIVDIQSLKRGMYVSPAEFEKALDIARCYSG